jgi:prepilin-type N-terminal cleavage/methylation domain-containing protein/prepilin-type processing-associated H-X9-DG protein
MRTVTGRSSRGRVRAAFSLLELLIVIAVLAILAALLFPGVAQVRETAHMTRCRTNLHSIWEAYAVWRSEHQGMILNGGSWTGRLMPYVEYNLDIFKCPSRVETTYGMAGYDYDVMDMESEEAQNFVGERQDFAEMGAYTEPDPVDACFEFYVYHQQGWDPSRPDYVPNSGVRSDLAFVIPLDGHPWVQRQDMGNRVMYKVDDEGSTGGAGRVITYDDLWFYIYYDDKGQPSKMEIVQAPCRTSAYKKYFVDFLVNGEVFVKDWVHHVGETLDFALARQDEAAAGGGAYTIRWNPKTQTYEKYSRPLLVLGDYALSRGSYERRDGSLVHQMDPHLFLILDFGYSKNVADFNMGGNSEDTWDQYFITDIDKWTEDFPEAAKKGWQTYQALRHFERANVLFSDGHIESLGAQDLYYGNPLWVYEGR